MAYGPTIMDASGICTGTVAASTWIKKGALVGYSSGLVLADADATVNVHAIGIAMLQGGPAEEIRYAKSATILDMDAPFTANTPQYLSGTAGGWTETLPATGGDTIQVIGMSEGTDRFIFHAQTPRLENLFFVTNAYDTTGEPGLGTADTGWAGPQMDAAGEDVYILGRLPSNMVELLEARILTNSIAATAIDLDLTIAGAFDGGNNNEDTGAAQTTADWDSTGQDNYIDYIDIAGASHLMDAGFALPGRNFCVWLDMDGITSGDAQVLGISVKVLVV